MLRKVTMLLQLVATVVIQVNRLQQLAIQIGTMNGKK